MKHIIFYFTGTGNSRQVAQDISAHLEDCLAVNIAEFELSAPVEAESIGFVFPVYWGGLPKIAHGFLDKLQITGSPYIYFAACCGGETGAVFKQVKKYIQKTGRRLSAGFSVPMPDNYVVQYEPFSWDLQEDLFLKEREKAAQIAGAVAAGAPQRFENLGSAMFRLTADGLNRSFIQYVSSKDMDFNVSDACTSCGKCESYCSVGNIIMQGGRPAWQHQCEFCMGCINVCPERAINYKDATNDRGRYLNPNV